MTKNSPSLRDVIDFYQNKAPNKLVLNKTKKTGSSDSSSGMCFY